MNMHKTLENGGSGGPSRLVPRPWPLLTASLFGYLGLALLLTSCGLVKRTKSLFGGNTSIQVSIAEDVNQNSPVAVDLIVVYNKKILDKLLEKSAREWFAGRDQFERDFPKGFQFKSWEWVPGQEVEQIEMPIKSGAKTAVVFADYFTAGQHRAVVDPRKPLRLRFEATGFVVEETL